MTAHRVIFLLGITGLVVALLLARPSGAADDNRVAVVVDFGDDVATRCVSFAEPEISGFEALQRSGLALEIDQQAGGAAVCRVAEAGCPADDCFCACRGGEACVYWSYWHLNDGEWVYASVGAGQYQVSDGMVDGWVWGPGSVTEAEPPPTVSFDEVCPAEGAGITTTNSESAATPIPAAPAQPAGDAPWLTYGLFAAVLLAVGALALIGRHRKG